MKYLVSVITPTFNSERYIFETYKSLCCQIYTNWEWLVVDDCSYDETLNLIKKIARNDRRVKVFVNEINSGAAVSRNLAIKEARGRFIAFLDSDDIWLPHKLEKQLAFMEENNFPFTFAAYDRIDEHGKVLGQVGVPTRVSYSDLLKLCYIGCLTAIYDTEFFGKVYMPLIRRRQDFGLWLKLLRQNNYAYGLNVTVAQYRVRKDSISANKVKAAISTWHLYRDVEGLNLIKATYYFSNYAINHLLRNKLPSFARLIGVLD